MNVAMKEQEAEFILKDNNSDFDNQLNVKIKMDGSFLAIQPQGYGEPTSEDGSGYPILMEIYEGRLRLIVWDDINCQDPKIIDLEKSKETLRKEAEGK